MKFFTNLRKYLPTPSEVGEYRYIHIFGDTLKQADLWTFNRTSIAKGIAVGLFSAFLPMPFQMIAAIFIAAMIGGNIPFALAGSWVSNPLTWIPLYTPCYQLGSKILNIDPIPLKDITILEFGWHYVALWLGCLIIGTLVSLAAHFTVSFIWRAHILRRWEERRELRRLKKMTMKNRKAETPNS